MVAKTITLADGAGGAATQKFIQTEILSRFSNAILDPLEDSGWIVEEFSRLVVTTDSFIVNPPIFPGGNIGALAVSGVTNDLLVSGAIPRYLTFGLIMSDGFPLTSVQTILDSIEESVKTLDVQIVAGDTKVINNSVEDIIINMTGIGEPIFPQRNYSLSNAKVGDKIIITGTIGDHGFSILSYREGLGFDQRVQSDCVPLIPLVLPILKAFQEIHAMRDPTRGGVLGTLLDIVEASGKNVLVDAESLPIKPEVVYGCEMLGINPLNLVNEGKIVMVVGPSEASEVLSVLQESHLGQKSAIIGEVQQSRSGLPKCLFRDAIGNMHIQERLEGLEVPRLC